MQSYWNLEKSSVIVEYWSLVGKTFWRWTMETSCQRKAGEEYMDCSWDSVMCFICWAKFVMKQGLNTTLRLSIQICCWHLLYTQPWYLKFRGFVGMIRRVVQPPSEKDYVELASKIRVMQNAWVENSKLRRAFIYSCCPCPLENKTEMLSKYAERRFSETQKLETHVSCVYCTPKRRYPVLWTGSGVMKSDKQFPWWICGHKLFRLDP